MTRKLTVISGGQTGVDRAALDAALETRTAIDGWCPQGRVTEEGRLPERYTLKETPSSRYPERTEWNVRDADGTLILTYGRLLGGTALTAKFVVRHRKPSMRINLADPAERRQAASRILRWMRESEITRLNIAGPRASTSPEAYSHTKRIVSRLIQIWNEATRDTSPGPDPTCSSGKKNVRRTHSTDTVTAEMATTASGDEGSRTLDLSIANAALCQLSYVPSDHDSSLCTVSAADKAPSRASRQRKTTPGDLLPPEDIKKLQSELPRWFARFGRELPWRETHDPYRIWISEIMLQQTTVTAVRPYYDRFLARFPDVASLAMSTEEEVLRMWEGLGYYSRGRNLRKAAQIICDQHQGRFPESVAGLMELPGIGRYVAGAVASFAFGKRAPIVEANTLRLYCRLLGYRDDPRNSQGQQTLWAFAESILPKKDVGDFNQALMDLGSMICTPKTPDCPRCPLKTVCRALGTGHQNEIPLKASRPDVTDVTELTVAVIAGNQIFIRRRGAQERWAGLWDFPRFACEPGEQNEARHTQLVTTHLRNEYGLAVYRVESSMQIKHAVTRYRIDLRCYTARLCSEAGERLQADEAWVERESLAERPMSVTGRKFAQQLVAAAFRLPFRE